MTSNLREPSQQHAVVTACFSDYKLVKTRSVIALVFEVPIERQAAVFAALGFPMPGEEISCAIVRLNPGVVPATIVQPQTTAGGHSLIVGPYPASTRDASEAPRPVPLDRRPAGEMSRSEQGKARYAEASDMEKAVIRAARLSKDFVFRDWCARQLYGDDGPLHLVLSEDAASYIRNHCCNGESRARIADEPAYYRAFLELEAAYKTAVGLMAEPR